MYKYIFIISSAILYALPFFYSNHLWWLVFLFPVPLFYVALHKTITLLDGYVWGITSFALHLSGVVLGMVNMAQGNFMLRMLPGIALIVYEGVYGALWFWCMGSVQRIFHIKQKTVSLLFLWVFGLWAYIYVVDHYCLWIFERAEGYFLMHPLLPLMVHPQLLRLLPIVGKQVLALFVYCVSGALTAVIVWRSKLSGMFLIVSLLPWVISYSIPVYHVQQPAWLSRVVPLAGVYPTAAPHAVAQTAADDFKRLLYENKKADIIILPESSFYTCDVFTHAEYLYAWSAQQLGKPVHVLVGSFGWDNNAYRNCMYYVADGVLHMRFAKRHAMPVTEYMPSWLNTPWLYNLYFTKLLPIVASDNERPCIRFDNEVQLVPYICSELFFQEWPDDAHPNVPIVSLTNDRWCGMQYVQQLLCLATHFKALQWQRGVLYISYTYARWFDAYGNEIVL